MGNRKADKMITEGRVKVNGIVTKFHGYRVDNSNDEVTVDDVKVKTDIENHIYLKMWKPAGVECTERPIGYDIHLDRPYESRVLVKDFMKVPTQDGKSEYKVVRSNRLFSIGRLDKNTTGLLLFTSDGQLANDISLKYSEKEYLVATDTAIDDEDISKLRN